MSQNVLVNTGNILSLSEAKKKASHNPEDELFEILKITFKDSTSNGPLVTINTEDDVSVKGIDRKDLKITVKVFISAPVAESLKEALGKVFDVLSTDMIESLVVAYSNKNKETPETLLSSLQCLWKVLEEYAKLGKLSSVGLSDVDTDVFISLFKWANVKPNIIQINLATCCVVPPALQTFTKENDVQLLTHSDRSQILSEQQLQEIFGEPSSLHWAARYQVHLKCRGILSSKGYLVYVNKPKSTKSL